MSVLFPARAAIVGHCPGCGRVVVVTNSGGVWPPIECGHCDLRLDTTALDNRVRLDYGWQVSDGYGPEREVRKQ